MKYSIKTKLILSYTVIILLMAGISMSFVSLFSETYMVRNASDQLRQYADRIAISLASKQTAVPILFDFVWDSIVRGITEKNYALAVMNEKSELVRISNFEIVDISPEDLATFVASKNGKSGIFVMHENRETFVICSRQMKNQSGEIYATIAVLMQVDRYNFDNLLILLFFASIIAASAIAVASAVIFSGQLTRNIRKLQKRAEMIANRKFDSTIEINANDEIGELANSLDSLAKSIEEYDKSQKVFLQNASHELRTPLMSIRGYVEGLKDGIFTKNTDEVYESILNQTSRLEKLVEDVIYLSKIETTKDVLQLSEVRTDEIVDEAIERVDGIAVAKGIRIVKGEVVKEDLLCDGDHLATVFTNLFSNALRYAKSEIKIEACSVENGVIFTVTDDGPGIRDEEMPHLFDRFFKGSTGKHGLGLAIVKAIAVAHKGRVEAYNRKDGKSGAVFEVFIPKEQ
ncbi:MAG: HAMP domain-containing histidine kinase [Clostridia bacterium]|nr:HAMP domain-containing histidine kinase [Clostridia bacterium]